MFYANRRRAVAVAALTAVTGAGIIGAGSAGAAKKKAAKKSPVKIYVFASDQSQVLNTPEVWAGAKAAALRINKDGGMAGHKIQIVTCNTKSDTNMVNDCARKAVNNKAIAVLSPSETFVAEALPILNNAKIPFMGSGSSIQDQTLPNSFPLGGGSASSFTAALTHWKKQKVTDIAVVTAGTAPGIAGAKQIQAAIEGLGLKFKGLVTYPLTTQDFAPFVQQLQSTGAKGVVLASSTVRSLAMLQAARTIGFKPLWSSCTQCSPPSDAKKYKDVLAGVYLGGSFPPANAKIPGMKQFRADARAAKKAGVKDTENQDDGMVQSWLSVGALTTVGKTIKGNITGRKMMAALSKAKNIDLQGLGKWSPGGKGLPDAPRLKNGIAWVVVVQPNGTYKLEGKTGVNVFKEAHLTS
jgi:ABC-type branched-subunit amino acid transport system substrate-binding protein